MGHLPRLIAFDLDGTLIDSRRDLADSANELIVKLGGAPLSEDAIGAMVGEGAALLVKRALAAAGVEHSADAVARFLKIYDARLVNHTRLYDGINDALRIAHRFATLGVLTNKPVRPTERLLEAFGIRHLFHTVISGDGPYPRKPNPEGVRAMMTTANAAQEQTLLVGDSAIDLETARQASVSCCLVSYGFGFRSSLRELLGARDVAVDDVRALRDVIARFVGSG